ncbi:hypothetical protein NG798_00175 [Ancylothrix sp. C2]|nr:hypothetical protein [Ancylothrix sp. D3o]
MPALKTRALLPFHLPHRVPVLAQLCYHRNNTGARPWRRRQKLTVKDDLQ